MQRNTHLGHMCVCPVQRKREDDLSTALRQVRSEAGSREATLRKALQTLETDKKNNEDQLTKSLREVQEASAQEVAVLKETLDAVEDEKLAKEQELLNTLRETQEASSQSFAVQQNLRLSLLALEKSKKDRALLDRLSTSLQELEGMTAARERELEAELAAVEAEKTRREDELTTAIRQVTPAHISSCDRHTCLPVVSFQVRAQADSREADLRSQLAALEISKNEIETKLTEEIRQLQEEAAIKEATIEKQLQAAVGVKQREVEELSASLRSLRVSSKAELESAVAKTKEVPARSARPRHLMRDVCVSIRRAASARRS